MPDLPQVMPWHKNWLVNPEYDRVDLVKEGANSQARIKLMKSRGGTEMNLAEILKLLKPEHVQVVEAEIAKAKSEVPAEVAKSLTEKDEAIAKAAKDLEEAMAAKKAAEDAAANADVNKSKQTEEEIIKSIQDPGLRQLMESQINKTKAAEAVAKSLMEAQNEKEAIAKAKEVPAIGAEEAKVAEIYKKLKAVDATLADDVFTIFKSADALITKSAAFQEQGGNGDGDAAGADEASAWDAIEKAAEPIAKSKNISQAAAIQEVIKARPELYAAYRKAQG